MKKIKAVCVLLAAVIFAGCGAADPDPPADSRSTSDTVGTEGEQTTTATEAVSESETDTEPVSTVPEVIEDPQPEYVEWMLEEKVHEIRIEIDQQEWQAIKNNPYNGDYHPANVSIDGERVENVGLRTRGHASLEYAIEKGTKYPFKIKFDKYVDDQTFMGLDELALNNGGDDFAFIRDYICYEAFQILDGYTSCVTYFNVYLNDELKGFYVGIEAIDKSYLERHFGSHKHNLYEGENGATLETFMSLSCFTQKKGSDTSMEDIQRLIEVLDETPTGEKGDIESCIDVDSVLKMFAVNAVLDNRDGYCGIYAHNYYFYNADGRLVMLPWDMNAPSMSAYTDIASPTIDVFDASSVNSRPLAKKLLAVEEYYARYLDYCGRLTDWLPELKEQVERIYEMIKPCVEADGNIFSSLYWFNYQYSLDNTKGVMYLLTYRYDYLTSRLEELIGASEDAPAA